MHTRKTRVRRPPPHRGRSTAGPAGGVARQFIYTARTANDATITLPGGVKNDLRRIGLAHQSIALTRVNHRQGYPRRSST